MMVMLTQQGKEYIERLKAQDELRVMDKATAVYLVEKAFRIMALYGVDWHVDDIADELKCSPTLIDIVLEGHNRANG